MKGSGLRVRVIVANVFIVFDADFRIVEEVDEGFCQLFVLGAFGNGQCIGPNGGSFLRNDKADIGIVIMDKVGIAGPHHPDPRFFSNEFLLDGIRIVSKDVRRQGLEVLEGNVNLARIRCVVGKTMFLEGHANDFTAVVEEDDASLVYRVPQILPAGRSRFDVFLVVDDACHTPGVDDGIFTIGVKGILFELIHDEFRIGHLTLVEFFQKAQFFHGRDHVVRRLDNIILGAAGLQFGKEFFIIGKDVIVDLAVIFFLEFLDDFRIEVISPAKNVEDTAFFFFVSFPPPQPAAARRKRAKMRVKRVRNFS